MKRHKNRWLWERPGWMHVPQEVVSALRRESERLEARETELRERLGLLPEREQLSLLAEILATEQKASHTIEQEPVSFQMFKDAFALSLGLPVPEMDRYEVDFLSIRLLPEPRIARMFMNFAEDDGPMTTEKLNELHRELRTDNNDLWGRLRPHDVGVYGVDRMVYEAPPHGDVPELMERFCDWWNGEMQTLPKPLAGSMAHLLFVTVHPYFDGNGRMSRLLMNKASTPDGIPFHPYSTSDRICVSLRGYYESLERVTDEHGIENFASYLNECREAAQTKTLESLKLLLERMSGNIEEPVL